MKPRIATNLEDLGLDKSTLEYLGFTHFYIGCFSDNLHEESCRGRRTIGCPQKSSGGIIKSIQTYLQEEDLYLENPSLKKPEFFSFFQDSITGDLYKPKGEK